MKMTVDTSLVFFILSCVIPVTIQQSCCPNNYTLHIVSSTQAICIMSITTPMNFDNALASCEMTSGASLLKLHPYEDVQNVINATSMHWIGLRRDTTDGVFRWTSDSTRVTLNRWGQNEPANFNCVRVNTDLTWSAVSCSSSLGYICQADVNCEVSTCVSTIGEARCPCAAGFVKVGQQCQDINECDELSSPCNSADSNVQCGNIRGSYNCECNPGFSRDSPNALCTENQECNIDADCTGNNQACRISHDGVRRCQCVSGYTGATCGDIDECDCNAEFAECINVCENGQCEMRKCAGDNEVCANVAGSFTCNCASGFVRNERNFCIDVDECAGGICSGSRQTCTNTIGSFVCACDRGYELSNSSFVCVESCVGRCNADTENCVSSDFSCVCKNGYFRTASGICQDIDECADPMECKALDRLMVCSNIPGSFTCQCLSGYQLVSNQCMDVNECEQGMHNCPSTTVCNNTEGSFMCVCGESETLENGNCIALRNFRVKIIATELNNTIPSDPSTSDTLGSLYSAHFCKVIVDILERAYPNVPEDCSPLRFDGVVTGYLRLRMGSSTLTAFDIERRLEENVVLDVSGDLRIRSDDTLTTITIVGRTSSIDVVEFGTTLCNPSPCQNSATCVPDTVVIESQCVCPSGFSGEFCEIGGVGVVTNQPTTTVIGNSNSNATTVIIIVVVIIAILLVTLLCCGCVCCCLFFSKQNALEASRHAPRRAGPSVPGPGVAPYKGPPSVSGFRGEGYYEVRDN